MREGGAVKVSDQKSELATYESRTGGGRRGGSHFIPQKCRRRQSGKDVAIPMKRSFRALPGGKKGSLFPANRQCGFPPEGRGVKIGDLGLPSPSPV